METIFEIQRIKQVKEEVKIYNSTSIRTPEDAYNVAKEFIGEDDREIFSTLCFSSYLLSFHVNISLYKIFGIIQIEKRIKEGLNYGN